VERYIRVLVDSPRLRSTNPSRSASPSRPSSRVGKARHAPSLERRKAIANAARSDAEAAEAAATSNEERAAANFLEGGANAKFGDVNFAAGNVRCAASALRQTNSELRYAETARQRDDARIVQLRGIIARDNSILAQR
jgi:hypothetical protein